MIDMPKVLRLIRAKKAWDQAEMGRQAGIHSTAVSRMESGKRKPNIKSIEKLAKAAKIPFELLATFATNIEDQAIRDERDSRFMQWVQSNE